MIFYFRYDSDPIIAMQAGKMMCYIRGASFIEQGCILQVRQSLKYFVLLENLQSHLFDMDVSDSAESDHVSLS